MTAAMKPPFAYYGGKQRLAEQLHLLLPPHQTYVEPFFGSGALFFAKRPVRFEVINDLDGLVVNFFRILRDRPADLEQSCRLTPHSRQEFEAAWPILVEGDELETARRFFVRVTQSVAKTGHNRTGWSITTNRTQSVPGTIAGRFKRFAPAASRLAGASLENLPAVEVIEKFDSPDVVFYLDPPYPKQSRAVGARDDYAQEMTEADHRTLAEVLDGVEGNVVLSGYPCSLYDGDLFKGWSRREFPTVTSSAATTTQRSDRVEVIWSNFDLAKPDGEQRSIYEELDA